MLTNKISEFIINNSTYTDIQQINSFVLKHLEYNTSIVVTKDGDVIGYMRFNIMPNGDAHICDLIIDKKFRNTGLMREIFETASFNWPDVTHVVFERGYDDGTETKFFRRYPVEKIIRRTKNVQLV